MTEEQYKALLSRDDECLHGVRELQTQVALMLRLLNGSPEDDIKTGVRPRLYVMERRVETIPIDITTQIAQVRQDVDVLKDERSAIRNQIAGARLVMSAVGVTSLSALIGFIVVLIKLFGGG